MLDPARFAGNVAPSGTGWPARSAAHHRKTMKASAARFTKTSAATWSGTPIGHRRGIGSTMEGWTALPSGRSAPLSGGRQARYWWASGSCGCRPLIGTSPVPRSEPQSVSCLPHYHPGRRDFPGPVGSEGLSAPSLPAASSRSSVGARTLLAVRFAGGLTHRGCVQDFRTLSSGWPLVVGPPSPRAPWLRRRYPPSSLLRAHAPIPVPPIPTSALALWGMSLRLRQPRLVTGTFPLWVCPSLLECCAPYAGGSSGALDQFFPDDIGLRRTTLGSAHRESSHQRLQVGAPFSARQAFLNVAALQLACPPDRSAPLTRHPGTLYARAFHRFVASSTVEYATRPTGRLPGRDSHPQEKQPFSAAP